MASNQPPVQPPVQHDESYSAKVAYLLSENKKLKKLNEALTSHNIKLHAENRDLKSRPRSKECRELIKQLQTEKEQLENQVKNWQFFYERKCENLSDAQHELQTCKKENQKQSENEEDVCTADCVPRVVCDICKWKLSKCLCLGQMRQVFTYAACVQHLVDKELLQCDKFMDLCNICGVLEKIDECTWKNPEEWREDLDKIWKEHIENNEGAIVLCTNTSSQKREGEGHATWLDLDRRDGSGKLVAHYDCQKKTNSFVDVGKFMDVVDSYSAKFLMVFIVNVSKLESLISEYLPVLHNTCTGEASLSALPAGWPGSPQWQ